MEKIKSLTEREKQVSDLVMQGLLNKQIALQLGISERTVEFHLNNIYSKLEINSRVELAVHLLRSTVDPDEVGTHNDSQLTAKARRAKALKNMLSLIKKETVRTMKIFSEDLTNYFRTRPFLTGSILVIGTSFIAQAIIGDYGLYFRISYILLGLLLAIGSLYFGLSWSKFRDGQYNVWRWVAVAFIVSPVLVIAVDTVLLHTAAKNLGEVMLNLPGISNKATWLIIEEIPRLSVSRSTSDHGIWLIGSLIYILLLTTVGSALGRRIKQEVPITT